MGREESSSSYKSITETRKAMTTTITTTTTTTTATTPGKRTSNKSSVRMSGTHATYPLSSPSSCSSLKQKTNKNCAPFHISFAYRKKNKPATFSTFPFQSRSKRTRLSRFCSNFNQISVGNASPSKKTPSFKKYLKK